MKTEIDPMMESEYMSWNKKQLIQDIQNKKNTIEELRQDIKNLNWAFTEQAIKIDEKNYKIQALRKALEDIQFFSDPMGGTSNMGIYNIAYTALKK